MKKGERLEAVRTEGESGSPGRGGDALLTHGLQGTLPDALQRRPAFGGECVQVHVSMN